MRFLVALAGRLVGLVLGDIRLPAVLLLASSPAAGGGANIAISRIAGARLTGRLSERQLLRAIVVVLVVAGIAAALQVLV